MLAVVNSPKIVISYLLGASLARVFLVVLALLLQLNDCISNDLFTVVMLA